MVPVLLLLSIGGLIAIRSGIERPLSGTYLWNMIGNLSQVVVRIAGYVAVLLSIHYWIGLHPLLGW
jgi:hypothetical protein